MGKAFDPYQMSPSVDEVAREVTGNPNWKLTKDAPMPDLLKEIEALRVDIAKASETCGILSNNTAQDCIDEFASRLTPLLSASVSGEQVLACFYAWWRSCTGGSDLFRKNLEALYASPALSPEGKRGDETVESLKVTLDATECGLVAANEEIADLEGQIESLTASLAEKEREVEALAKFKAYVHKRLDEGSVPANPEPPNHALQGCRIGDRLDWLFEAWLLGNGCADLAMRDRDVAEKRVVELEAALTALRARTL